MIRICCAVTWSINWLLPLLRVITPGLSGSVAWDWWNDWNLYGVDFRAGVNTETYKYYIDFASKFGIEYVILDEGWAVAGPADLFQIVPEIDLKELIRYAGNKKCGTHSVGGLSCL